MEIKQVKCTTCGSQIELDHDRKTAFCKACNNSFVVSHGENLNSVEVDKTKDLKNNRRLLDKAVGNDDIDAILTFSDQIRKILPDDYVASYFHAYASKKKHNPRYMNLFYQNFLFEATERDIDRVIKHIIEKSDLRDYKQVKNYLSYVRKKQLEAYEKRFNERKRLEDNYASIPRDAFICHRSTDNKHAQAVVKTLESDGYTCWISSRNLRPNDNENYWRNIKDAIDQASIFLVVSSQDAMLSNDVQREIEYAQSLNKPRLEVKIDEKPHTSLFKYFFDGMKWIDAYSEFEKGLSELKERFFAKKLEVKKKIQKEAAKKVEKRSKDENYIVRARVENEQGNDKAALDFIEKALEINVESPDAWWLKFLVKHHFRSTKEFDNFINGNDSFANIFEILQSNEYMTAQKFSNSPEYFEKNEALLEKKLSSELKEIVKRKNKADLKYLLELRPDHETLKWYQLLFDFELFNEDTLDSRIEDEQFVVSMDSFFNSSKFETFIESIDNKAKYLKFKDRFERFKESLGEKHVKKLYSYDENINKTINKLKVLMKDEKYKKAVKKANDLKKYGPNGEKLFYYYNLLVTFEFKNESEMFESLRDVKVVKESEALLKSKPFKQLKESKTDETLVSNIEETVDETSNKSIVEYYHQKAKNIEKKYFKKYYVVNFLMSLSVFFTLYWLLAYGDSEVNALGLNDFTLSRVIDAFSNMSIEFVIFIQFIMIVLAVFMILYTGFSKERKRSYEHTSFDHKERFSITALNGAVLGFILLPILYFGGLSTIFSMVQSDEIFGRRYIEFLDHNYGVFVYLAYFLIFLVYFITVYLYYRFVKKANKISSKIYPNKTRFRLLILPLLTIGVVYLFMFL